MGYSKTMQAEDRVLIAANARIMQLKQALFAMFDAYEGVYDMVKPHPHQSDAAKHAEGLAKDALAGLAPKR
jgi:hypothetical protein